MRKPRRLLSLLHPFIYKEFKAMPDFTGKQAQFQNLQKDGLKIRSSKFKNQKRYDRTAAKRAWKSEG